MCVVYCVHMPMCLCVYVLFMHVPICICMCVCAHAYGFGNQRLTSSVSLPHFAIVSHLNLEFTDWIDWLASEPQGSSYHCLLAQQL